MQCINQHLTDLADSDKKEKEKEKGRIHITEEVQRRFEGEGYFQEDEE